MPRRLSVFPERLALLGNLAFQQGYFFEISGEPNRGLLGIKFRSNPFYGHCRCPNAREKPFRPFFSATTQ
jgi:hypothetical protein